MCGVKILDERGSDLERGSVERKRDFREEVEKPWKSSEQNLRECGVIR